MNQSQIKHLKERLREVKTAKTATLPTYMTTKEKEEEFAAGRYEIQNNNGNFMVVFPRLKEKYVEVGERRKEIVKEYDRILDEIILGDAEGALEALNKFREQEF